ncbi:MAG: EAL domain-containing protein [Cellulomonas sp.]|nr:EAL domain-containing protein [Cellulomonas sp.]
MASTDGRLVPAGGDLTLSSMVEPCPVVPASTPCAHVDQAFRTEWTAPAALVRAADGSIGLLGRASFLSMMAGRYGYGRSLWGKRPIAALATWGAATVRPTTTVAQAAALIADSPEGYRDLPVVDENGLPVGVVRPVRVMRALADQTAHRAAIDELTGVSSRARFIEELDARVAALAQDPGAVAVVFLDLDRLKQVNDLFGHSLGDALLRSVARRLTGVLDPDDLVGRLGGDEFAVVSFLRPAPGVDPTVAALALGERLRASLAERDETLPVLAESRASVGVAVTENAATDTGALLRTADEAMYAAKTAGGDRVRLAGPTSAVGRAVPTDDLLLVYQPVVDVRSGRVTAVEALLRTCQADGSLGFPSERLHSAARAGTTLALDRWVLERACQDMVRWAAQLPDAAPPRVHVNLAPESIRAPDLADTLLATIEATGCDRDRVCLELSEYAGVDDLVRATPQLAILATAGVRFALDDMGATLGALRLLGTALPIDCVKVDRSVVEGSGQGLAFDAEMLSLVRRLAERFTIDVVAEGVETAPEDAAVRRSGIHHVQGFLHSRPLLEDDLVAFLAQAAAASAPGAAVPQPRVVRRTRDTTADDAHPGTVR